MLRNLRPGFFRFFVYAIFIALALASALAAVALWPDLDERLAPLVSAVFLVALLGLSLPPLLILVYRAVQPVLSHAKRIGPATYLDAVTRGNE